MEDTTTTQSAPKREPLLRDVTFWSRDQMEAMGQVLFFDREAGDKLSEDEKEREIQQVIWVHHVDNDEDDIERLVASGDWEDAFKKFRRNPRMLHALPEVNAILGALAEMLADEDGEQRELEEEDEIIPAG